MPGLMDLSAGIQGSICLGSQIYVPVFRDLSSGVQESIY
jgi:hypothetical protein